MTVQNQTTASSNAAPVFSITGKAIAIESKKKNKNKNPQKKKKKNIQKNEKPIPAKLAPQVRPNAKIALKKSPGALPLIRHMLHPPVPAAKTTGKNTFDLRDRTVRRNLAIQVLRLFPKAPRAAKEASKILSGFYSSGEADKTGIRLHALEMEPLSPLENPGYEASAANELKPGHERYVRERSVSKKNILVKLEDELVDDELKTNALGAMYYDSLLTPCNAPNPGVPDEENRGLSMKIRVRTTYLLPMTGDEAYVIVSRNPARHIQIRGGGGVGRFFGPTLTAGTFAVGKVQWKDEGGAELIKSDSYSGASATSTFSVAAGHDKKIADDEWTNIDGDTLDLTEVAYLDSVGNMPKAKMLPCAAGDLLNLQAWTSDVTVDNYVLFADFLVKVGVAAPTKQRVPSPVTTGDGSTTKFSMVRQFAAPANAIGLVDFGVINQGTAATTTVLPRVETWFQLADQPVIFPIGSSDLQDFQLLLDQADDLRVVGCRATITYVAKKLEGGYIVGGQLPQAGDDDLPFGSLDELAVIPGMVPRPLNGVTPGISFPIFPLTEEENDYQPIQSLFENDNFAEGAIQIRTTGADANLIILQTEMSLQARTERQVLMATTGEVDMKAVSEVLSYIAAKGPLSYVTGNDEHQEIAAKSVRDYAREHPTYSFFNGWFSGNTTSVSDVIV
jgi:hypothetical protein